MAYGDIGAVIEDLRFYTDRQVAADSRIIHISGNVYAIFFGNADWDGEVRTYTISDAGDIGALIDSAEWDGDTGIEPAVLHIADTIYAMVYRGPNGTGSLELKTISIANNGTIGSVIESLTINDGVVDTCYTPSHLIHISGTKYAVVYYATDWAIPKTRTKLVTLNINDDGTSLSVVDTSTIKDGDGYWANIIHISGTTFAIVYHDTNTVTAWLKTITIATDGTIGSVLDTLDTAVTGPDGLMLVHIASNVFAALLDYIVTFSVDSAGAITSIDSFNVPSMTSFDAITIPTDSTDVVIAIAYRAGTYKGTLITYTISAAGVIGALIDTLIFRNASVAGCSIIHVSGDIYAIAYTYFTGLYGHVATLDIETATSGELVVTTQVCTDTIAEKSTGHGTITAFGTTAVTQHGHCWSTYHDPTTSDSKTENGAAPNLGQFESAITGLIPDTVYYIRAYATDSDGTSYGDEVSIPTDATIGGRFVWVEKKAIHYFDEHGNERFIEGTLIGGYE